MENPIEARRRMVQSRIEKSFDDGLSVQEEIEKARTGYYADNAQNRKLMRVGNKYGSTKNTFKPGHKVRATLPTGKVIEATYVEPYAKDKHTVKDENGKLYGVSTDKIEKIAGQYAGKKRSYAELSRMEDRLDDLHNEIISLKRQRRDTEIDMEEELAQAGEEAINNGNHPLVIKYGKELEKLDNKIAQTLSKYKKQKETLERHGW